VPIMSAPSGIKVPVDIASSFSSAQSSGDAVRALVWVIEGGTSRFIHRSRIAFNSCQGPFLCPRSATL
jgi:hypothetical protein